jgi:hypothetical protein
LWNTGRPTLEHLEERTLLSGVQPTYQLLRNASGVAPLASPSPTGYTPAQVRHGYGFDQIQFGSIAGDGTGQTVAIVDAFDDPNIQSDLDAFSNQFGLPTTSSGQFTFSKVNQSGGTTPPPGNTSWAVEISLDVEWVHAIAPRANILLVEASDNSDANIYTAIGFAESQTGVSVVSMSFGEPEFSGETGFDSQYFQTPSGHSPVSFVASAGDSGAPPEYPSASPNVLSVGGTSLSLDSSGNYLGESAWTGGGGGLSAFEPQPAYQKGVVTQSNSQRATPDVSYDASPGTGFPVYDSFTYGPVTPWNQIGGTSAGAPQWSALVAIADQGRALATEAPLDGPSQLLPLIYGLPSADLHDITTGTTRGNPHEPAGPGYDLATGRGTPFANLVVPALVGVTSPVPTPTSTALSSSVNPTAFGESVTFTATMTSSGGTPTGSVTFMLGSTALSTVTLSNGSATFTTSALPVGGDSLTATYGGNTTFATSASGPLVQTVVASATTVSLASSLNPSTSGQSVTFTATVAASAPGAGTPTGTVTFLDGTTTLGTGTLSGGVATFSISTLAVGGHNITAAYGGDGNFTTSTSAILSQTVNPVVNGSTTTTLTSSANPSVFGQSVTFTATVNGSGGTPTGTVVFMNGSATLATKTLSGGTTTFTTSSLTVGSYNLTAVYSGDSTFAGSTSNLLAQTVGKASTTDQLTVSPSPATSGQTVTLTATLAAVAPGGGTPGGTVTFLDGTTTLAMVRLSGGVATFQTTGLAVGTHSLSAVWHGDSNFFGSTSPSVSETINPSGKTATTTTLSSSVNPSVFGQSVTFTATVSGSGGTPTGSVTFMNGGTTLGTSTLSGGSATFTTSSLPVGSDSITAVYGGDPNFTASTSPVLTQVVTSPSQGSTTTSLTSSQNPSVFGQSVTFTATVTGSGGTPTGTVTFMNGTATLATKTLSGGTATFSTATLTVGSYNVTAVYSGNTTFTGSTSNPVTQVVNKAATTDTLTVSPSPGTAGQTVTLTATLAAVAPGGGTPGGTVTFLDGSTTLGTARLSGGVATFQTTALAVGTHSLTAVWHGDSNYLGSTSPVVSETINPVGGAVSAPFVRDRGQPSAAAVSPADAVWIELQIEELLGRYWRGQMARA